MNTSLLEPPVDTPAIASLRMDLPTSAVEQVPMGIARVDREGRLVYANRCMLRMIGIDSWHGRTMHDLFTGEDLEAVLNGLKRRVELREGEAYEVNLTRTDGAKVPIAITAFPETDSFDEVIGTLALVRDLTLDRATEAMVKHVENISGTDALLDAIGQVLRPLVPFDLMQVMRLNASGTHLRTIYPDCIAVGRSYRWWRIPEVMRYLLDQRDPLILNDLPAWYEEQKQLGLPADLGIQQFLDEGFTATMSLPVFHDNKQVASVVLCRKLGHTFSDEEADLANRLPLSEAVSVAQRNDTESNLNFLIRLIRDIAAAYDSVQNVAQKVVERIAEHYGWDYVSIHQVNPVNGTIRLIAQQASRTELHSELAELRVDQGIVGHVHRSGEAVLVSNVETDERFAHIFVRHRKAVTHSELCVPIGRNAQWLLNVEDEKTEAFCPEDQTSLETVATSLDALLRRTLEYNYRSAVVNSASDAILLVDERNMVFEANEAASTLLQRPRGEIIGRLVADFLEDPEHAAVLLAGDFFANHGTFMRRRSGAGTTPVQVLLSVARLPAETPGRVFIASDLSQFVRGDELDLARELFREITGQVKTPMSLAIAWLRRFSAQQLPAASSDVPEKVLQQLQKADLTLDRMLLIERGAQTAPHFPTLLSVEDFVTRSLDDLPARERQTVALLNDASQAWVRADAFELRYCLQTVLTYLLRLAVNATRIELRTWAEDGRVLLEISGRADAVDAPEVDAQCRGSQAVAELSLGRQTLTELAERNGGHYAEHRDGDHAMFSFSFPRAPSGEAS